MRGAFWVGDIVSIYNGGVIHLNKLISDDMSAWEYRAGHGWVVLDESRGTRCKLQETLMMASIDTELSEAPAGERLRTLRDGP